MEEGVPYLQNETQKIFLQDIRNRFGPQINTWILQANQQLTMVNQVGKKLNTFVFGEDSLNMGITSLDSSSDRFNMANKVEKTGFGLLKHQWDSAVSFAGSASFSDLSGSMLLREGYRILTQLGEFIRGDTVRYLVVARTKDFERMYSYNLSLEEFLGLATTSGGAGVLRVKRSAAGVKGIKGLDRTEWKKEEVANYKMFIEQLAGYHNFYGKNILYPLKKYLGINEGQLIEAYLNSGFQAKFSESDSYWESFKPIAQQIAADAMAETLKKPSAFWQGGEGGDVLQNMQVKANYADVTNLKTLVRQMIRIQHLLNNIGIKIKDAVYSKSAAAVNISDEEVLEAIVNMFEREGWKALSVNWTI